MTLNPIFQPSYTEYDAIVGFMTTTITLSPTATDANASISINDISQDSGSASSEIELLEGENTIKVVVTAENEVTQEVTSLSYFIAVTRLTADAFVREQYIKASNIDEEDQFANSIAISGNTLVVGTRLEDGNGSSGQADNPASSAGAAYIFVHDGETWHQQAYLKASNAESDDWFGYGLAINQDTVVVGAFNEDSSVSGGEDDNSAQEAGAAYVFSRDGSTWTQQAYLKGSNTDEGDLFGVSVAIDGDTFIVGAGRDSSSSLGGESDNSSARAGAAYVFVRNDMSWSQQALLKASNTGAGDQFGWRVATDSNTIVIGAWREASASLAEDDNSASGAGAAYVFVQDDGDWRQRAYLKADNPDIDDQFGNSIAISGDTVVIGAWMEDSAGAETDNSLPNAGEVYVWRG